MEFKPSYGQLLPDGVPPSPPDSWLTVAEAAKRLGVSIPRLRRLLARPEFASCARQVTHETKTGTRTAMAVPVPVLPALQTAIEQGNGQQREREQGEPFSLSAQELAVYTDRMLAERERLIAEKDARIADLTARIEYLEQAHRHALEALAREQALRALPPVQPEAQTPAEGARPEEPTMPAQEKRPWWWPWRR